MKFRVMKWFEKIRFRRIRSRFFVAMIVLSLPPLFLLGYVSFNITKNTLMETNAQTNLDHLKTSSEVADLIFRNITILNRSIVSNNDVRDGLRVSNLGTAEEQYEIRKRMVNHLQRVINNNYMDTRFVKSVCLFDLNYEAYCLGRSDDAGRYELVDKETYIPKQDWYQEVYEAQGRVIFFGTDILENSRQTFSTVKLFRDSANGDPLGLLFINLSTHIFGKVSNESNDYGTFMVLDGSNGKAHLVYSNANESVRPPDDDSTLKEGLDHMQDQGYLISTYPNPTTGWMFVHLIKMEALLRESNKIRTATTVIATIIALVALFISYVVSGSITRPLLQLKKMMVDWTKGTRQFNNSFDRDEVGTIGETFKRISIENEELNERLVNSELKERDAELRALQAQIKPHFLYNTLDSIYWMATLQNNHQVAQMAVSLSESFKLSLNKGKESIPVYKELKHIEHYMTIQNIRYNNRFQYVEEVEPSIMGMEIMKLLLQPLVENAMYHGLEPKVGEGVVHLTGKRDEQYLVFSVEDNGIGIEDIKQTEQGYGLRNVRERLKLYYGADSSLEIFSEIDKGTKITLRFKPTQQEGDAHA